MNEMIIIMNISFKFLSFFENEKSLLRGTRIYIL